MTEIAKNIFTVGVKDWTLREFHGYSTPYGTTYNSYLIMDDVITLIDGVKAPFTAELIENIRHYALPEKIGAVVCNHVEMDHSGALPEILSLMPNAVVYCPEAGKKALQSHYDITNWNIKTVKTGDTLNIGKHSLTFVQAQMVHWPDSMMTYEAKEKILFSNDAFGQHVASDVVYDDEYGDCIFRHAKKYYANIVEPYGLQVKKVLGEAKKLDIAMIAPSHGLIWRSMIPQIVQKYDFWASYNFNPKKALVVYDTMWGSTEKMAKTVARAWSEKGLQVTLRSLKTAHISDVADDCAEARFIAFGSPALNGRILPEMGALITYLSGLGFKKKIGFCFGSYGWKANVLRDIQDALSNVGWLFPEEYVSQQYRPSEQDLKELFATACNVVR